MSILLAGLPTEIAEAAIEHLTQQGDEVRILTPRSTGSDRWKALGAYVATGALDDDDLVERAATGCRTVVLGEEALPHLESIAEGLRRGGMEPRIVLYASELPGEDLPAGFESIVLKVGRKSLFRRTPSLGPSDAARAIDAADDLTELPVDVLDLMEPRSWAMLGLEAPG